LQFSSYLLCNKEFATDLCAKAPGVLQELDELCMRFRIDLSFINVTLNPEPLNVEPEQLQGRTGFDIPGVVNGYKIIASFWKENDK